MVQCHAMAHPSLPPCRGYSHAPEYYKAGGYLCPSDIFYGRPKRAVNTYGKWKVDEKCIKEEQEWKQYQLYGCR